MKVIKPIALTDAMLVSSSATETVAAWNAATNYSIDAQARLASTHRIYTRLVAGISATSPDQDSVNWFDTGPDNTLAMFDGEISTSTSRASSLTVVVDTGYVNSLALIGIGGSTSLTVATTDGAGGAVLYGQTINLDGTIIADWYQYFFEPSVLLDQVVFVDLPPYVAARTTVTLTGPGTVSLAHMAFGSMYELGDAQYGATAGITDYSRKDTDAFGVTTFTRRAYAKRMSLNLMLDSAQMNKVQRVLADLRATPCVWIGAEAQGFDPLTVFGFYRDFSITVAYPTKSLCSLEIEGLS